MTTKTENLDLETLNSLKSAQSKLNDLVFELGQVEASFIQLKNYKNSIETEYVVSKTNLDSLIKSLESKYPNGEIDLTQGTITFQQ